MTATLEPPLTRERPAPVRDERAAARSRFWRTVWRVHFYAGMFVVPFLLVLAITGTLILYRDPINALTDGPRQRVDVGEETLSLERQVAAVRDAFPGVEVGGVTPPSAPDRATMVSLDIGGDDAREAYVDPYTGEVIGSKVFDDDLPGLARDLHGNLLFGWQVPVPTLAGLTGDGPLTTPVDVGDLLIELAACWGVVLVVSGLYLWWPRKREAGKALFRPRLSKRGRARWRDLHAVPGAVLGVLVLFLVVTGLPWSGFWGGNWDHLTNDLGTTAALPAAPASDDAVRAGDLDRFGNEVPWASRSRAVPNSAAPDAGESQIHEPAQAQHEGHAPGHQDRGLASAAEASSPSLADHAGHAGNGGEGADADGDASAGGDAAAAPSGGREGAGRPAPLPLDAVARAARAEGMAPGFSIALPVDGADERTGVDEGAGGEPTYGSYTVTNPFTRTSTERTVFLDQFTGEVIDDHAFDDYGMLAQATAWGIDVHMGTQYGLANRIVMTLACVGVVWSVASGLVMWWKRRPHGKAGLPRRPPDASLQRGLVVLAIVLGALFPLVGVSMVAVVLLDRYVIRRAPTLRRTFGMR